MASPASHSSRHTRPRQAHAVANHQNSSSPACPPAHSPCSVLIGLSNHDNVGGCFRNAAALGTSAVLLDETCCDPLYRKAIRVSSGAALSLPFAHTGQRRGSSPRSYLRAPPHGRSLPRMAHRSPCAIRPNAWRSSSAQEVPGLPTTSWRAARGSPSRWPATWTVSMFATAAAIALSHVSLAAENKPISVTAGVVRQGAD